MLNSFEKKQVADLKASALNKLVKHGINDSFTLKIKEPVNEKWVACYRAKSQFKGKPIFWLDKNLLHMPQEFIISILHEYGHVIAEYAWARSPALQELIRNNWKGQFLLRPWDEEDFAEEFAQYLAGNFVYSKDALDAVIHQFTNEVFEQDVCSA